MKRIKLDLLKADRQATRCASPSDDDDELPDPMTPPMCILSVKNASDRKKSSRSRKRNQKETAGETPVKRTRSRSSNSNPGTVENQVNEPVVDVLQRKKLDLSVSSDISPQNHPKPDDSFINDKKKPKKKTIT